jgi:lipopolysaccharide transport system ATP-binding protein
MSEIAIQVDGLGKRYSLGGARKPSRTAGETLTDLAAGAFRRRRGPAAADRSFWALRDVSFDVRRGEVVGIIGRNGAGKSTLLKVLSRITDPTEGGVDITGRVGSLLEVGTGFHPELTGRENVYLNGAILGMRRSEITKKFDEIVAFAETEKFLDTPVKFYSSGMYTRLAFAVAAHLDPEILIVDEVLAVGDAEFQKKCLGKMKDVAAGGRTVLFVSHNLAAVRQLCTSALMLQGGRVVADGPIGPVLERYLSRGTGGGAGGAIEYRSDVRGLGLRDVYFTDTATGRRADELSFAGDYELCLALAPSAEPIRGAAVVTLTDLEGNKVSSLTTAEEGLPFFDLSRVSAIRFAVPDVDLAPGQYRVSVALCDQHTSFLHADAAIDFSIEPRNVNGAAWAYNRTHGFCRVARGVTVDAT